MAGDLNLTEDAPEFARLRDAGLSPAEPRGFGWTFPAAPLVRPFGLPLPPGPVVGIDHVLHSRRVAAAGVRVLPDPAGSDHLAVVADLLLLP